VPQQKPEWKRYKQYTRNDIMSAIDAVRNGMSALQAARKFGVPSRTLYDKVKKLGITTSRPFKRGSFPFGLGGNSNEALTSGLNNSGSFCSQSEGEEHASSDHHISKSDDRDEGTAASVLVRASPCRTPPSPATLLAAQGHFLSDDRHARHYHRSSSSPSPTASSSHSHDEVEDLSVSRKPIAPPPSPPTPVAMPLTPLHPHIVSLKDEHRSSVLDEPVRTVAVAGGGGDLDHD
jgi:hypothetical protein